MILLLAALLPPLYLMFRIYKEDKVEREPVGLIAKTCLFGALSIIPVVIVELILGVIIGLLLDLNSVVGILVENFIGVALVEEFFKMQACRLSVWKNREFNYTFDGMVYAVAAAIGFAALENVEYVLLDSQGLSVALMRAVTAIPGHTIFGIFMGLHLGMAKYYQVREMEPEYKRQLRLAFLIPVLLHGSYDFLCSVENDMAVLAFLVLLVVMDVIAIRKVKSFQQGDRSIYMTEEKDL